MLMTQREAAEWLAQKDYLEPDERLTDVGLTVGNDIEDNEYQNQNNTGDSNSD